MEDGQTLFDYNVGLNDIVQLLIRSQSIATDSDDFKNSLGNLTASASTITLKVNKDVSDANSSDYANSTNGLKSNPEQDHFPTSSRCMLINAGIGSYKVSKMSLCG